MNAQTQRGAQNNFVEDGGRRINEQVATARGAHDGPDVAGVRFEDFDCAFSAEKFACAVRVAIAAPDSVSLAHEQLSKQGARAAYSEDEYAHRFATLSYSPREQGRTDSPFPSSLKHGQRQCRRKNRDNGLASRLE